MRTALLFGLALLLALALGCGSAPRSPAASTQPTVAATPAATSGPSTVAVIVMENKEADQVLGSPNAPYLTGLANTYAQALRSYGVTHPSLPNYIALTSGSTQGITSDCTTCHVRAENIVDQLEARRISWKGYMQGMPRPCFTGAGAGRYAKKHNPFMYYDSITSRPARCAKVVPYARLAGDLRARRLPRLAFIAPDLCADTHDCDVRTGDRFLSNLVPRLLARIGPRGFVVVTYDEGSSDAGCCSGAAGGRIATVVAGPTVRRGYRMATPVDQYGVLRTVEGALRLPFLGGARDARSGSLDAMFRRRPSVR